jgi:hypothetical protein
MPRLQVGSNESTGKKSEREVCSASREHPAVVTNVAGGAESSGELPTTKRRNP